MRDFRRPTNEPDLYDAAFDALLIEQSIATQYGVLPAAQADLPYPEWAKLVGGLLDDTPLGRVVAVRAERDPKAISRMSPWAKRIRSEWQAHRARCRLQSATPTQLRHEMEGLEKSLAKMFGGGNVDG